MIKYYYLKSGRYEPGLVRVDEYEMESGRSYKVVNVGKTERDVALYMTQVDKFCDMTLSDTGRITFYFDNRTLPEQIGDAMGGKMIGEILPSDYMRTRLSLIGATAGAYISKRQLYFMTEELKFAEIISPGYFEKMIRHEIRHLEHSDDWVHRNFKKSVDTIRQTLSPFGFGSGIVLTWTGIGEMAYGDGWLGLGMATGGIALVAGSMELERRTDFLEIDSILAEKLMSDVRLIKDRPRHIVEKIRLRRKLYKYKMAKREV